MYRINYCDRSLTLKKSLDVVISVLIYYNFPFKLPVYTIVMNPKSGFVNQDTLTNISSNTI